MEYLKLVYKLFEYRATWLVVGLATGNEYTVNLLAGLVGLI